MADTREKGLKDVIVRRRWVVSVGPEPARVHSIASRRRAHARVRRVARVGAVTSRAAAA